MSSTSPVDVFTPSNEIYDTERFAGRSEELQTLSHALASEGSQIVIYGKRGVGKSSLARQLEKLARGHDAVMDRLQHKPAKGHDFLPIYFRCDDSIRSIPDLLLRLLNDERGLAPWVPYKVVEKEEQESLSGKVDVKVFSMSGGGSDTVKKKREETESDVHSIFDNAVRELSLSGLTKDGVLIIVDEFDRIENKAGLASLMRTLGPQKVKFALVGISTNIQELIRDHESVSRQLADGTVRVPVMPEEEMEEIFTRAENLLDNEYEFERNARKWIINVSRGHPFYVQLIGKHSLLRALREDKNVISLEIAKTAMEDIALKESAPIQESSYKTAVGNSYPREYVLKEFARQDDEQIYTSNIYERIASDLGVDKSAISVYVGHLSSDKYGNVLEKTRDRYYRFKNSLFKAYAAARPWQLDPNSTDS